LKESPSARIGSRETERQWGSHPQEDTNNSANLFRKRGHRGMKPMQRRPGRQQKIKFEGRANASKFAPLREENNTAQNIKFVPLLQNRSRKAIREI
jgi:hypothetical protein